MTNKLTDEQNQAILHAINKAIDDGPWDKSTFLKAIGNNLTRIRDDFLNQLGAKSPAQLRAEAQAAQQSAARADQLEVFVALYSSDGANMQVWERIVANLPTQMISRPIYEHENEVKEIFRFKGDRVNDAYVAMYINKTDILPLPSDKVLVDRLGKKLLSLRDRALNLTNLTRFCHISGTYEWVKGTLVKKT